MAESAHDVRRMALGVLQSRLMDFRQLEEEFKTVLGRDYHIRHSFTAAQAPINSPKNRYVNVLPYDHNRVLLRPCAIGASSTASQQRPTAAVPTTGSTAANGHYSSASSQRGGAQSAAVSADYINASHVVHDDSQCGFSVRYIACQGPLATTVADFWRMCWSEGVGAVVMLTNTVERGVTKCSPYYPSQPGERLAFRPVLPTGGSRSGTTSTDGGSGSTRAASGSRDALSGAGRQGQQQQVVMARQGVSSAQQVDAAAGCSCADPRLPSCCVAEVVALSSTSLHGGDLTQMRLQLRASSQQQQPRGSGDGGGGGAADVFSAVEALATDARSSCRDVAHLHYNAWPDHGTPADAAAIRTMCDLLGPVRAGGGAVVVHCSAGIGRTGTFCAIDILRRRLNCLAERATQRPGSVRQDAVRTALDLPDLVHSLRRQRGGMVQTLEQYAFCYQAVYEELLAAVTGERRGPTGGAAVAGGGREQGGDGAGTPPRQQGRR